MLQLHPVAAAAGALGLTNLAQQRVPLALDAVVGRAGDLGQQWVPAADAGRDVVKLVVVFERRDPGRRVVRSPPRRRIFRRVDVPPRDRRVKSGAGGAGGTDARTGFCAA